MNGGQAPPAQLGPHAPQSPHKFAPKDDGSGKSEDRGQCLSIE